MEFVKMPYKQMLTEIARMRREAHEALQSVDRPGGKQQYDVWHKKLRALIVEPAVGNYSDDQKRHAIGLAAEELFGAYDGVMSELRSQQKVGHFNADDYDAMLEESRVYLQEHSADLQRIDDAVERKVQERKNKGGRPKVGEKKGITVRMPDNEWVPVRAAINYYGYTDAEFFAEAAKLLAAQRIESLRPYQIEHYGAKDFGS